MSGLWSDNRPTALFERLMEIHSNPSILYYGFKLTMCNFMSLYYPINLSSINQLLAANIAQTFTFASKIIHVY